MKLGLSMPLSTSLIDFTDLLQKATSRAVNNMQELGFHTEHVSSTFIGFVQADCDRLCKAIERYLSRPDSSTQSDMYQCIRTMSDRVNIENLKIRPIAKLAGTQDLHYLNSVLQSVRGQFMQEHKGVDYASRPMDKDGNLYRTNSTLKLANQQIFERYHIGETD